ncbi:putative Lipoprotein [Streptomyces viridochromogenes Tue57]|uniref:Putative Lipoprotein n=1 Tax=Streptomyces viridochromogenes Tue57 TaxID=1160705 RepID=L8P982_STRVR|nr:putative Lipoprotein [Streptomyces viridochromogenes Tue57]
MTRPRLALAGAAAILALAGCGSEGDGEAAVPKTATGSLEKLAAEAKCRPDMQTDADEIRQAICKKGDEKYILATFATDRGQREWINTAKDYGGYYLVGRKWVAVGHEDVVTGLRDTLGGTLEVGTDHSGHSAAHDG